MLLCLSCDIDNVKEHCNARRPTRQAAAASRRALGNCKLGELELVERTTTTTKTEASGARRGRWYLPWHLIGFLSFALCRCRC